ncbi:MAG: isoprenyl transferase [Anaerovoracaceae bacterium]|jgi:undecaprenyl diphosphate synthase
MIDKTKIPLHVAIVMDGNGRWAQRRKLPRLAGHNAGMKAMKEIVKASGSIGVKHLTVYAFSTENWKRSKEEINGIFKLLIIYVEKELAELHENNVKVKILGDYHRLPEEAVNSLERTLEMTKNNTGLQFNIALNYGGRDDILYAIKKVATQVEEGKIKAEDITETMISDNLYTAGVPDPDLVIRTSGEKRLSNFLLWQCAYSEFVFTDVLWPDFTRIDFEKAIKEYQLRKRRYGGR